MKKISKLPKKILSLFIAVLMIVSSMPFAAVTASAAEPSESGLVGSYLTKNITDGMKTTGNEGNVHWDANEGAARFDGSGYLTLDGKPMEAVNSSTGFTISLDFKRDSTSTTMIRLFDFNNGSTGSLFSLNAGADGNNERYITFATPNSTELRYWANDLGDGNKCDPANEAWLNNEKPNTWYNITLIMETNGKYSFYVDGDLKGTFKPTYNEVLGSSVTPEQIMNSFSGFTRYMIGGSAYANDAKFSGYIKNIKLYDRAVDITSAIAGGGATNVEVLGNAIKEFESRMDGGVYQNMGTAYDYYVAANKAYDAAYYGGDATTDVTTPAYNLTQAMLGMHKTNLTPYTANNPRPTFPSGTVPDGTFANLLYSNLKNSNSALDYTFGTGSSNMQIQIGYDETVMMYDGSDITPKAPVMFVCRFKNGAWLTRTRYVYSVYPTTGSGATDNHSDLILADKWYSTGGDGWNFGNEYGKTDYRVGHNKETMYAGREMKVTASMNSGYISHSNVIEFKTSTTWSPDEYYKSYKNLYWNAYAGENSAGYNGTGSVNDNASIYVINYLPLKNAINADANKAVRSKVASYKEGGLSSYLAGCVLAANLNPNNYSYSTDIAGQVSQCATDIKNAVNGMTSTPTADTTSNYPALRKAFDYSGTLANFNDGVTYSVREAYNGGKRKGFSESTYNTFKAKYEAAQNVMKAVRTSGYVNDGLAGEAATALKNAFNALEPVNVKAPTLTESTVLGPNDTIVITNNEASGTVKYTIAYDGGAASAETDYTGDINVFNGSTSYKTAVVTAYCTVGTDDSKSVSQTYTFYKAPTIAANNGDILTETQTVAITSNNETAGTIQYSYDNSNWKNYTSAIAPFTENRTTTANIYAREVCGNATSATVRVVNLVKKATFNILSSTGDNSIDSTSTITFSDVSGYDDDILYILKIDGIASEPYVYDKENGIVVANNSNLRNAKLVEIIAYARSQDGTDQKVTAKFFNSDNYNPLAYQESFDGASISGNTLTTGNSNGKNATILGTGKLEEGAGYKDGAGNSPDWRQKVLKLSAYTDAPGNKVVLAENPLTNQVNAAAAQSTGATITFWRHIEDTSGNTVSESDNWMGAVTFREKNTDGTGYPYFIISTTGYISYHNDSDNIHADVTPDTQGVTKHSAGNQSGHWVQVAVTIDPNSGVKVYTNGELHDNSVNSDPAYARAILRYLTAENTEVSFANSLHKGSSNVYFFDDIRIYSTAMTQLEINQMYTDKYADVQKASSTGHDPTAVTVYTLTSGKQVGENYIQKNNCYDQIAKKDYYIFGTGLTVYHSTDNVNWEVVGDSQGRCGYQNQDLFGDVYTTALAEPLAIAAQDSGRDGAGKLVWAPHVMYNLALNKWCYYGSTSSWGSQKSAIFLCTSDNITGPYTYECIVTQSSSHPNAIDPVVFYDKDFSNLYMLYGSWGGDNAIYAINLGANGRNLGAGNYVVCRGINTGLEPNSTDGSSGEGAYVIYENGYYYLYVSYGQNTGTYTTRVFRSTEPTSGYVDIDGTSALDNTTATMHGNQFMHSFDLPIYDYAYNSTGHNSVYNTTNFNGEKVTINAIHARPWATQSHGMKALEDGALSTRQVDLNGNVTLINQIGYTQSGWPVAMPYQYTDNDTVMYEYTAYDIQGTFTGNAFTTNVNADIVGTYNFVLTATGETTGIAHVGTTAYNFEIKTAADGTRLINFYDNTGLLFEGVLGQHSLGYGKTRAQMGFVNVRTGENLWAYMTSQDTNTECSNKTVNITFENLFSFAQFAVSGSASATTSQGTASYDVANRTITVTGSGDNYTNHDNLSTVYKIPVTAGKTYNLDFVADNENAEAMIFVPNSDQSGYDGKYVGFRGGHVNGQNRITLTIPDGKEYVYFRFGSTNADNVTVTFSDIAFYEADRADYRGSIGGYEKTATCTGTYGELPTPTKDGAHFVGWFTDKEYTNQVTNTSIVYHSATVNNLYAKWEAHNYVTTVFNSGNTYTWTKTCSVCGDSAELSSVDASAYVSAVAAAQTDIANTVKYSSASIASLQNVLNNNTLTFANEPVLTQTDVETATNNIIHADQLKTVNSNGVLELATYTVTFNTVNEDKTTEDKVFERKYEYGSVVSLKADGVNPYKWTRDGDNLVAGSTDEFTLVVTGNTVVNAYYYSQTAPENQHVVTVYNRQGKIVGCLYVDDNATLTVEGSTISYGKQSVTPEKLPFYQVTGYKLLNGTDVNGYEVAENIDVYPLYSPQTEITITLDKSNSNIYFENDKTKSETTKKVVWDQKVTVKSESDVIWLVGGKAVAKGTSYTFRASNSITISTQEITTESPSSVITYAEFDAENKKARLAVSNYSSDKYKIKKQGIIFGTTTNMGATLTVEQLAEKGKKYEATKTTDTGDQFSYTLTFTSTTPKKLCVISYVVYDDGTTVYSENVTYVGINCEIN